MPLMIISTLLLKTLTQNTGTKILIVIQKTKKYGNPSITNIKKKYKNFKRFSFRPVTTDEVKKVIKDLKTNKSVGEEIPMQILKESEFTFECLSNCINHSIEETGIFKKDDPLVKSNYRPVSTLPLLSKVYERIIYNQLSQHSEQSLTLHYVPFVKLPIPNIHFLNFSTLGNENQIVAVSWVQF